jgi:hypothetical protein
VPEWLAWLTAPLLAYLIWRIGLASVRSFSAPPPGFEGDAEAPPEPEDVEELEVYLVCGECGTELRVSKLGGLQVPRHCGEKMQVRRRTAE